MAILTLRRWWTPFSASRYSGRALHRQQQRRDSAFRPYLEILEDRKVPAVTFSAHVDFPIVAGPLGVAIGDVSGDGKPDLVVANYDANSVSVLLNTTPPGAATPSFAPQEEFATGYGPAAVALADLNGDGKPDIIVTNEYDCTVSVLLNTTATGAATPSFAGQQVFGAYGLGPTSVAVADVNGDGKPDILFANQGSNCVSVLLNTTPAGATTTTFADEQAFAVGDNPDFVAVGDFNGDGKPDLVTANQNSGTVSVLLNTTPTGAATPSFAPQQTFAAGYGPICVAVGDINGDGKPDLAVVNIPFNSSSVRLVSVLLNTTPRGAAGVSFAAQQTFSVAQGLYSLALADVNGDGKPDILVTDEFNNTVQILQNTTAPEAAVASFAPVQSIPAGAGPVVMTAADLNGDGKPDLAVGNEQDNTVSVLLNTTAGEFAASGPLNMVAASVASSGPADLVGRVPQSGQWWVGVSNGSSFSNALWDAWAPAVSWLDVQTGDFNGDGQADIIGRDAVTGGWWVGISNGTSGFTTTLWGAWSPDVPWTDVCVADFNGDGKADLAGFDPGTGAWWVSLSTGSAFAPAVLWTRWSPGLTWVDVLAGDLNGDGKADLIGRVKESGQWWANISTGAAFQTELWGAWAADTPGVLDWVDVRLGDVNGDGRADVVGRVQENGQWWVSLSGSSGFTSTRLWDIWSTGYTWVDVQLADFNGDGKLDLVGRALQTGQWWVGLSTGAAFAPRLWDVWSAGVTWVDVQVGDFNGDGKADIVGRAVLDGSWWVGLSTGSAFATSAWDTWATAVTWVDVHAAKFT